MIDNFINCSFWFQKYLPLEYISNYDLLQETLIEANETGKIEKSINDLSLNIQNLNNIIFEKLDSEITLKDEKMDILKARYSEDVRILDSQYLIFKAAIEKRNFPPDDTCLDQIDEYYSRLIIRLGFGGNSGEINVYVVKKGDYFRKIAELFYDDEREWELIFKENKSNKKLLPNPDNADLIYPNVEITIPLLER
jgi:nucleoid-associated protein YgaU